MEENEIRLKPTFRVDEGDYTSEEAGARVEEAIEEELQDKQCPLTHEKPRQWLYD
jgi:hypothetical protein